MAEEILGRLPAIALQILVKHLLAADLGAVSLEEFLLREPGPIRELGGRLRHALQDSAEIARHAQQVADHGHRQAHRNGGLHVDLAEVDELVDEFVDDTAHVLAQGAHAGGADRLLDQGPVTSMLGRITGHQGAHRRPTAFLLVDFENLGCVGIERHDPRIRYAGEILMVVEDLLHLLCAGHDIQADDGVQVYGGLDPQPIVGRIRVLIELWVGQRRRLNGLIHVILRPDVDRRFAAAHDSTRVMRSACST